MNRKRGHSSENDDDSGARKRQRQEQDTALEESAAIDDGSNAKIHQMIADLEAKTRRTANDGNGNESQETKTTIQRIDVPYAKYTNDLTGAAQNVALCEYAKAIIAYAMDHLNEGRCETMELTGTHTEHAQFMKKWVMEHYGTFYASGRSGLSLAATLLHARAWLFAVHETKALSEHKQHENVVTIVRGMYDLCLYSNLHTKRELFTTLRHTDLAMIKCMTTPAAGSEQRLPPDTIEAIARTFACTNLQMYYMVKHTEMARPSASVLEKVRQEALRKRDVFLDHQISEGFHNRYSDFVYQHWLTCGLVELFRRKFPESSARTQLVTMVNGILPEEDVSELKDLMNADIKKALNVPRQSMNRNQLLMNDLIDLMIMGYMFQQDFRVDWFDMYYIPQSDFLQKHVLMETPTRWRGPDRRPVVCMLLGRWCISTHDMQLVFADTGMDAFVLWLYLVYSKYKGTLESGRSIASD